jgi:hypothetical protein
MDHAFVYGYIAFALGVLSLIFLIIYSWRALWKIRQVPVKYVVHFYWDEGEL